MILKFTFSRFFPLLLLALFCFSSSVRADKIDDYVRAQMNERHIPGAALAVVRAGKTVKLESYGLANVELNVPATKDTVFEIGSVSKQITAAAVMLLVEEGKINLDEKISKYLPNTPESWNKVTVRNLLTHTSGIKNYTGLSGFELIKRSKRDDFIKAVGALPLEFEPGERWIYSNTGYNLLGFIIESASNKSYWDFLRERIFIPLGMNQTADRDPQFIVRNRADGYEWENNRLTGRDWDLTDLFAAGAIVSTIADLAKWEMGLRGDAFLKKTSKEQIWTPFVLNDGKPYSYGFGWNVGEFRGHKLISHTGHTAGFSAAISRYANDDLTVIVLTNLGTVGIGGQIARGVAKIYLPEISLRQMKEQFGADAEIAKQLQNALRSFLSEKLETDSFAEKALIALTSESAKRTARRVNVFGAIKNFVLVGSDNAGENRIYRYRVETPARLMLWRFAVDKNGKIAEMALEEEE
ncbi:MAG TPA: serine hydrolase domain-containing protein [Pyrinomonadaceae bacterium]|jgi:CubicO group peptidase (beta-lactamase class C family)